jgi:hypothetical protein
MVGPHDSCTAINASDCTDFGLYPITVLNVMLQCQRARRRHLLPRVCHQAVLDGGRRAMASPDLQQRCSLMRSTPRCEMREQPRFTFYMGRRVRGAMTSCALVV